MIKTIAALLMLIDHAGMIFFPQSFALRIIGRLSMPLFAYCVARGFYFSSLNGTTEKYARNLFSFAVVSQIPYTVLAYLKVCSFGFNIGFTWFVALLVLKIITSARNTFLSYLVLTVMVILSVVAPLDYGLYGVLCPCVFYFTMFHKDRPQEAFAGLSILYALYVLMGGNTIQAFSLVAFPVLLVARKYDDYVSLPRRFFYWFYPVHLTVMLLLRSVV